MISTDKTFNQNAGRAARDVGMVAAIRFPFHEPVVRARNIAILLSTRHPYVTADMVHEYLAERLPEVLEQLTPAMWGLVFKTPKLRFNGRVVESKRVARHTGIQRCWEHNPGEIAS